MTLTPNLAALGGDGKPPIVPGDGQQPGQSSMLGNIGGPKTWTDQQLLDKCKDWKKESFDQRWIFERQWMRNIWYLLNRQWIYYDSKRGQWQDKRLAKWIPRPVTNICKEGVQSIRANFASINYGASARPLGEDNASVVTAGVADDYGPILYKSHNMTHVMNEFDFWLLVCGNAWLHTCVNKDIKNGTTDVNYETCVKCQQTFSEIAIHDNKQMCPTPGCGSNSFMPATNPDGSPKIETIPLPKGMTMALSPFEIAFPLMYDQYDDAPYTIRMRWRDKNYYQQSDDMIAGGYDKTLSFTKTPQERTMQIFKTLPFQGDIGIAPPYFASGGANTDSEGIVEYDFWVKPCADFPEGQVIRIAGDGNPVVIHSESEALPGPLPYHNAKGDPIFAFHHGRYEHVGGRVMGSGLIDPAIQKQDQLNQLDSHIMMTIGRMANPVWLEPKGAEVEKFTGEPGLVVKWNPLVAGGNAKPERIPGEGVNASVFMYRALVKQEAEELMGTFDIMKGEKPAGTEAYAAMSFLYERATGRHASAFKSRAEVYKGWYGDALEIEREFGDETRLRSVMTPSKGWAFETFKKSDLSGAIEIIIEDGTITAKTALMERAAIDHLATLGLIDPSDPDQKMEILRKFGEERLMPGIDAQVQEAWMNMDAFEKVLADPVKIQQMQTQAQQLAVQAQASGQPMPQVGPLIYRRWYNPQIHRNELIKWCLSDRGRKVFLDHPAALQMVDAYLTHIDLAIAQISMGIMDANGVQINTLAGPAGAPGAQSSGGPPEAQGAHGAAQAAGNSNRNAAGVGANSSAGGKSGAGAPTAIDIAQRARASSYLAQNPPGGQSQA